MQPTCRHAGRQAATMRPACTRSCRLAGSVAAMEVWPRVWLRQAEASGIPEMLALVRSLWLDRPEVEAAVQMEWSNGQVEGSVNKLKLTKRAMYGRAKFDLLRTRLLH